METIKPKPLLRGDTVGIIAPSFFIEKKFQFERGIKILQKMEMMAGQHGLLLRKQSLRVARSILHL